MACLRVSKGEVGKVSRVKICPNLGKNSRKNLDPQPPNFSLSPKLSIATNRTLVLPPMFLHFHDQQSSHSGVIDPNIRLNTNAILKFVSTTNLEHYLAKCGQTAEVVITPKAESIFGPNTEKFEKFTGISVFEKLTKSSLMPTTKNLMTSEKCAILSRPYQDVKLNIQSELPLDIVDFPDYTYQIVEKFIDQKLSNSEVFDWSIHWRYSSGDWSLRCKKELNSATKADQIEECQMMKMINHQTVAEAIFTYISKQENLKPVVRKFSHVNLPVGQANVASKNIKIYIASPPSEYKFLSQVRDMVENLSNFKFSIFLSQDLENFVDSVQGENCQFYHENKGEVLSLSDQTVAVKSRHFIKWPRSSWSNRVQTVRQMKKLTLEPVNIVSLLEEKVGIELHTLRKAEDEGQIYQQSAEKLISAGKHLMEDLEHKLIQDVEQFYDKLVDFSHHKF